MTKTIIEEYRGLTEKIAVVKSSIASNKREISKLIRSNLQKSCKSCKNHLTYFDCSQCHDFDEWVLGMEVEQ